MVDTSLVTIPDRTDIYEIQTCLK